MPASGRWRWSLPSSAAWDVRLTWSSSAFSWLRRSATSALSLSFSPFRSLQRRQNVVQLIQPLQNVVAALFLLLQQVLQYRHDVADAAGGHDLPCPSVTVITTRRFMKRPSLVRLLTSGSRLPSPAVVIWSAAAPYFTRNRLHCFGAPHRQAVVVARGTDVVGVSGHFHTVIAVLAQHVRQAQQTGISVRENRRIELEIDLFPLILGLAARVESLSE